MMKCVTLSNPVERKNVRPLDNEIVRVKETGNVLELMWLQRRNKRISIRKISNDEYILLATGEVKRFDKQTSRADNVGTVKRSLAALRDLINCNCTDVSRCRWVTLTYRENMTDSKRLYRDFKYFVARLRYRIGKFEYIVAAEPQGRGAWHLHLLMIFRGKAPYIANEDMARCWRQGFVKVKKLDNVDNVGAYLTAYLGDMSLDDVKQSDVDVNGVYEVKTVNVDNVSKKIIKGLRLSLYPPKFNLYRCSRGVKRPTVQYMSNKSAEEKASSAKLTFEKTVQLSDDDKGFSNLINYRYYNYKGVYTSRQYKCSTKLGKFFAYP